MGQYSRQLKNGKRWYFSGQYLGKKYHSKAIYKTKGACAKEERERLKQIEEEINNPDPDFTLLDLCNKRLNFLETKSKNYYKDNRRLFRKIIKEWGSMDVSEITRPMIHGYLVSESKRLKRDGFDNYAVNAEIRYLKALFSFAIDELGLAISNPTKKIKFFPVKRNVKYIPPEDHIELVRKDLFPHQLRLFTFCEKTACRVSEALRATGDDIDEETGLLTLWTRKKKYGDLTPRRINLPPEIVPFKKDGLLFPEWSDYPRFLEKKCKRLGIKLFGFHAFRHKKASEMAKNGVPINEIQYYLGHESILVTQQYLHLLGFRL